MKEWECTFINKDGKKQIYYFYSTIWITEDFCKTEIEKIFGKVTEFKMVKHG